MPNTKTLKPSLNKADMQILIQDWHKEEEAKCHSEAQEPEAIIVGCSAGFFRHLGCLPSYRFECIDWFYVDGLFSIFSGDRTSMGADTTACAIFLDYDRAELIQFYGLFLEWTYVVTGPA